METWGMRAGVFCEEHRETVSVQGGMDCDTNKQFEGIKLQYCGQE
jgi:hypothetical protein